MRTSTPPYPADTKDPLVKVQRITTDALKLLLKEWKMILKKFFHSILMSIFLLGTINYASSHPEMLIKILTTFDRATWIKMLGQREWSGPFGTSFSLPYYPTLKVVYSVWRILQGLQVGCGWDVLYTELNVHWTIQIQPAWHDGTSEAGCCSKDLYIILQMINRSYAKFGVVFWIVFVSLFT